MSAFTDWSIVGWEVAKTAATRVPEGVSFETLFDIAFRQVILTDKSAPSIFTVQGPDLARWTDVTIHKVNLVVQKLGQV